MFAIPGEYEAPCHIEPEPFTTGDDDRAQQLCQGCRIILICLEHAQHYEEISGEKLRGVRGGLTEAQRAQTTLKRLA